MFLQKKCLFIEKDYYINSKNILILGDNFFLRILFRFCSLTSSLVTLKYEITLYDFKLLFKSIEIQLRLRVVILIILIIDLICYLLLLLSFKLGD